MLSARSSVRTIELSETEPEPGTAGGDHVARFGWGWDKAAGEIRERHGTTAPVPAAPTVGRGRGFKPVGFLWGYVSGRLHFIQRKPQSHSQMLQRHSI